MFKAPESASLESVNFVPLWLTEMIVLLISLRDGY
jgi:hypothetical protein